MGVNRFVNIIYLLPLNALCYLYKLVISIGIHSFKHSVISVGR